MFALAVGAPGAAISKAKARLTVLHSFAGGADGATPYSTLLRDKKGNLFGTTLAGDSSNLGTVFVISRKGVENVLHSFTGGNDGASPYAGLVQDASGTLYGTTYYGGASGLGTVYKITPGGTESVIHAFAGIYNNSDGSFPYGALLLASDGNLWGTTVNGGSAADDGAIYVIDAHGEAVLYAFDSLIQEDGTHPYSNLIEDDIGGQIYLVGTTYSGQYGYGGAFSLVPPFDYTDGCGLAGNEDGQYPMAGLVKSTAYSTQVIGSTTSGGIYGLGVIFLDDAEGGGGSSVPTHSFASRYCAGKSSFDPQSRY